VSDGPSEFGLVMPFVTVASEGGPHEDEAYVCGFEMGHVDAFLEFGKPERHEMWVHAASVDQADLIAMRNGYRLTVGESYADEWTAVTFELAASR
jgi:hypothetical protein